MGFWFEFLFQELHSYRLSGKIGRGTQTWFVAEVHQFLLFGSLDYENKDSQIELGSSESLDGNEVHHKILEMDCCHERNSIFLIKITLIRQINEIPG
jgi:hypothetical protein